MDLINYLDGEMRKICTSYHNYKIFRFGSSLFSNELPYSDIDYLVVDTTRTRRYSTELGNLKEFFADNSFLKSGFATFDPLLNIELSKIKNDAEIRFNQHIEYTFIVGPSSEPVSDKSIHMHLAGPMCQSDFLLFFENFPLFYLIVNKYNISLCNMDFDNVIQKSIFSEIQIKKGLYEIYKRAENNNSIIIKRKCLKRIKLLECTIAGSSNSYYEAQRYIESIKDEDIIIELYKYRDLYTF